MLKRYSGTTDLEEKSNTKSILQKIKEQQVSFVLKDSNDETLARGVATYSKREIFGSEYEAKIIDSIQKCAEKLTNHNRYYEYACQFEKENECKKAATILNSSLEEYKDLWEKVGIVYADQDIKPETFPKYKVCIQRKYENNLLTSLTISYKGRQSWSFSFDLEEIEKKCDLMKKNKLEYADQGMTILEEAWELSDSLSPEKYVADFKAFLKKWPMMNAVITPVHGENYCNIEFKDRFNLISAEVHAKNYTAKLLQAASDLPQITFTETLPESENQRPRLTR